MGDPIVLRHGRVAQAAQLVQHTSDPVTPLGNGSQLSSGVEIAVSLLITVERVESLQRIEGSVHPAGSWRMPGTDSADDRNSCTATDEEREEDELCGTFVGPLR